ncbi:hypothetical protein AGMMS50256_23710 [Betaproteobacteria bacterium]|nr:hypothetical protein AGMMS50256_23710 [Betaproteobacteria bacterium]
MKRLSVLSPVIVAICLSACTTVDSVKPSGEIVSQPGTVLAPGTANLVTSAETLVGAAGLATVSVLRSAASSATTVGAGLTAGVAAATLYVIYDPLAPNWTIEERELDCETYHLSLRAKHFRVGGDGEAMRIVKRRAAALQREKGYAGYRLLDYSEGIESATPLTYRISEGTIQLVKNP